MGNDQFGERGHAKRSLSTPKGHLASGSLRNRSLPDWVRRSLSVAFPDFKAYQ